MGVTAAVVSAMLFMTAHGRPRFASTITDAWTIRSAFLLGILGAFAAATASWRTHERQSLRTSPHDERGKLATGPIQQESLSVLRRMDSAGQGSRTVDEQCRSTRSSPVPDDGWMVHLRLIVSSALAAVVSE
jgi:hypothetical protein